jgi:hypothetical protein
MMSPSGSGKVKAIVTIQFGVVRDYVWSPVPDVPELEFSDYLNFQLAKKSGGIGVSYPDVIPSFERILI